MLRSLRALPMGSRVAPPPLPLLPAWLVSGGHELRTSPAYDWNGLARAGEGCLLQYTLEGRGRLTFAGLERELAPGDLMVVHWPHDHRYRLLRGGRWRFGFLVIRGPLALRLWRGAAARCDGALALDERDPLVGAFADALAALLAGAVRDPYTSSRLAYDLAMRLATTTAGEADDRLPPAIRAAQEFARRRLADDIGVDDLARAARLSRAHFTRAFAAAVGRTPGAWLLEERLARAADLLADPDLPLAAIAARTGFRDANYFGKAFRRVYGRSPGSFRREGLV